MPIQEPFRVYNAESLGHAVRHFREQAGLTQTELAERVGIQQYYLSQLETGKVTEQTRRLVALFKTLGVRIVVGKADW
jgi:transcriptional regulator with XRE-family HTH domain